MSYLENSSYREAKSVRYEGKVGRYASSKQAHTCTQNNCGSNALLRRRLQAP